jgi:hypothetical protein
LVEVVQALDLLIADVDLLLKLSKFVFDFGLAFLDLFELEAEAVSTFVSFGQLFMPLAIRLSGTLLCGIFFMREETTLGHIIGASLVDCMAEFEFLEVSTSFSHNV